MKKRESNQNHTCLLLLEHGHVPFEVLVEDRPPFLQVEVRFLLQEAGSEEAFIS